MKKYSFAQLDDSVNDILTGWKKLIYIAGASASGKTYIAEVLSKKLQETGKKVLTISSDNYYASDSGIKSVIYGTYDHPALIDYALLSQNIDEYFTHGSFNLPLYSFAESRRTGFSLIQSDADIVIVEWLYTISQLPTIHDPFRIYINSSEEDLIIRRLLRDPIRVGEPLHMVVSSLNNVFPMWHLYGNTQSSSADVEIFNDYDLLAKDGKIMLRSPLDENILADKKQYNQEEIIEYRYNDSTDDTDGKLLITEHYEQWFLKSVGISKTHSTSEGNQDTIQHISMRIYKPGVLTQIHNLVQNAGLHYEGLSNYTQITYLDIANIQYIVERRAEGNFVRYEKA